MAALSYVTKLQGLGKEMRSRIHESKKLHPQQKQALRNIEQWFGSTDANFTAVISMPTGTGKTGVICCLPFAIGGAIAEGIISPNTINLNKPILIIAPGLSILDQLERSLLRDPFLKKMGLLTEEELVYNYTLYTVRSTADIIELELYQQYDVILTNSQKWRRKKKVPTYEDLPRDLFSMVIVDEAHHLPAPQWQEVIDKFQPYAKVVFFTATPFRSDDRDITADGTLSTGPGFAYKLTREEAIRDRLIREVRFPPVLQGGGDPILSTLNVLVAVRECINNKNEDTPLPGKFKHTAIIVARNIEEATKVESLCTFIFRPNQLVLALHSDIKPKHTIKDKIDEIKEGKYSVVIIVSMILEGFDFPPFSVAGIVTRIRSRVKFAQFIGRVQRIVREGGVLEDDRIRADVITHSMFEQEELIEKYKNPVIDEIEDQNLDVTED